MTTHGTVYMAFRIGDKFGTGFAQMQGELPQPFANHTENKRLYPPCCF
jgi:hypothetical protein